MKVYVLKDGENGVIHEVEVNDGDVDFEARRSGGCTIYADRGRAERAMERRIDNLIGFWERELMEAESKLRELRLMKGNTFTYTF